MVCKLLSELSLGELRTEFRRAGLHGDFSEGLAIVMLTVFLIKNGHDPYTFQFVPESAHVKRVENVDRELCDEDEKLVSRVVPNVADLESSTDGADEEDLKSKPNEVDDDPGAGEHLGPLEEIIDISVLITFNVRFDIESFDDKEEERSKDGVAKDVEAGLVTTLEYIENPEESVVVITDVLPTGFFPVSSSLPLDLMSLYLTVNSSCAALFSKRVGRKISVVIHNTSDSDLFHLWSSSFISPWKTDSEALRSESWPPDRCSRYRIMIDGPMLIT